MPLTDSNGKKEFLNDIEVEEYIKGLPTRELLEFTARQSYDNTAMCVDNQNETVALKKSFSRLKRVVYTLIAFLTGTGIIGTGLWGIFG